MYTLPTTSHVVMRAFQSPPQKKDKCCYDSHHTHKETEAHEVSNTGKQSWEQITRSLPLETPLFFTLELGGGGGGGVESGTLSSGAKQGLGLNH